MSFKSGQKVTIKGTDIVGTYAGSTDDGTHNVEVHGPSVEGYRAFLADYYLPLELIEAVTEPITVEIDPVELPLKVPTWFGHFDFVADRGYFTVGFHDHYGGPGLSGKNINYPEARKLAHAILTITESPAS